MTFKIVPLYDLLALQMKAFDQEGAVYSFLIPTLQRVRSDKNLTPWSFAKCYYSSPQELIIILENMKVQGYTVVEKKPERKLDCFYNEK